MTSTYWKSFFGLVAVSILFLSFVGASAFAESHCPAEPSAAIAQAREALKANHPEKDRIALTCLVEAVAALEAKAEALRDGSMPIAKVVTFRKVDEKLQQGGGAR